MKSPKRSKVAKPDPQNRANAAAWAWYMHNEGNKNSLFEACLSHRSTVYRPSRFKQEAMEKKKHHIVVKKGSNRFDMAKLGSDFGSCLFDSYEVVALSDQLDRSLGAGQQQSKSANLRNIVCQSKDYDTRYDSSKYDEDSYHGTTLKRQKRGGLFQALLGFYSCVSFSSNTDWEDDDHVFHHGHEHHSHHHHHHHHYYHGTADALTLKLGSCPSLEDILLQIPGLRLDP